MRRISDLSHAEILAYNLRDNGTAVTVFADTQAARVERARGFIRSIIEHLRRPVKIWELGCSAGDISGWFSAGHEVTGVDIVPAAVDLARTRYPAMNVWLGPVEAVVPQSCDILVLCEFLEHVDDPIHLVKTWLPIAEFAVIGHPLHDPGNVEPGHIWSYDQLDYDTWLELGGHTPIETHLFSGPFPEMVMGASRRST